MKTKAPKLPQRTSERRALFERAIHEAGGAQQHLTNMADGLSEVAAPVGEWQRDAKRLAEVTGRLKAELGRRLELYVGIEDTDQLLDPDEGFEPERKTNSSENFSSPGLSEAKMSETGGPAMPEKLTHELEFINWWESLPIAVDDGDYRCVGEDRIVAVWDASPVFLAALRLRDEALERLAGELDKRAIYHRQQSDIGWMVKEHSRAAMSFEEAARLVREQKGAG